MPLCVRGGANALKGHIKVNAANRGRFQPVMQGRDENGKKHSMTYCQIAYYMLTYIRASPSTEREQADASRVSFNDSLAI